MPPPLKKRRTGNVSSKKTSSKEKEEDFDEVLSAAFRNLQILNETDFFPTFQGEDTTFSTMRYRCFQASISSLEQDAEKFLSGLDVDTASEISQYINKIHTSMKSAEKSADADFSRLLPLGIVMNNSSSSISYYKRLFLSVRKQLYGASYEEEGTTEKEYDSSDEREPALDDFEEEEEEEEQSMAAERSPDGEEIITTSLLPSHQISSVHSVLEALLRYQIPSVSAKMRYTNLSFQELSSCLDNYNTDSFSGKGRPLLVIFWNMIEGFDLDALRDWLLCCHEQRQIVPILNILLLSRQDALRMLFNKRLTTRVKIQEFVTSVSEKTKLIRLLDYLFIQAFKPKPVFVRPGAEILQFMKDYFDNKSGSLKIFLQQCRHYIWNHYRYSQLSFLANTIALDSTDLNIVLGILKPCHLKQASQTYVRINKLSLESKLKAVPVALKMYQVALVLFCKTLSMAHSPVDKEICLDQSTMCFSDDTIDDITLRVNLFLWLHGDPSKKITLHEEYKKLRKAFMKISLNRLSFILSTWGNVFSSLRNLHKLNHMALQECDEHFAQMLSYSRNDLPLNHMKQHFDKINMWLQKDTNPVEKPERCASCGEEVLTTLGQEGEAQTCQVCHSLYHIGCGFREEDEETVQLPCICFLCQAQSRVDDDQDTFSHTCEKCKSVILSYDEVQCESCSKFFHLECADVTEAKAERICNFYCTSCRCSKKIRCKDTRGDPLYCDCLKTATRVELEQMLKCQSCSNYFHPDCVQQKKSSEAFICSGCGAPPRRRKSLPQKTALTAVDIDLIALVGEQFESPKEPEVDHKERQKQDEMFRQAVFDRMTSFWEDHLTHYTSIHLFHVFWADIEPSGSAAQYFGSQIPRLRQELTVLLKSPAVLAGTSREKKVASTIDRRKPAAEIGLEVEDSDICAAHAAFGAISKSRFTMKEWITLFAQVVSADPKAAETQQRFYHAAKVLKIMGFFKNLPAKTFVFDKLRT